MKLEFCVACGAEKDLHHHHLIPKALVQDKAKNYLITLCYSCHRLIHGLYPSKALHSELTKKGLEKAKREGRVYSRELYGFDAVDGFLVPNLFERSVIKLMMALREEGLSYGKLAQTLNDLKIRTKQGYTWDQSTIYKIVKRHKKTLETESPKG